MQREDEKRRGKALLNKPINTKMKKKWMADAGQRMCDGRDPCWGPSLPSLGCGRTIEPCEAVVLTLLQCYTVADRVCSSSFMTEASLSWF